MSFAPPALALIVAMDRLGVIGRDGTLPWHIPEDLRHFRRVTTGHAVIMGRRTHESIGRALPQRRNIVVTRNADWQAPGCEVVHTFDEALALARQSDAMPIVIGGAALYEIALPMATRIYLTRIDRQVSGDTVFPSLDLREWRESERRTVDDVTWATLDRVAA